MNHNTSIFQKTGLERGNLGSADLGFIPVDPGTVVSAGKTLYDAVSGLFGGGHKHPETPSQYNQAPNDQVSFFVNHNYEGTYISVPSGGTVLNMKSRGINDMISSIKIPKGMKVTVYGDANFSGRQTTFTTDQADLKGTPFQDMISSIRVSGQAINPAPATTGGPAPGTQSGTALQTTGKTPAGVAIANKGFNAEPWLIGGGILTAAGLTIYAISKRRKK